MLNKDFYFDKLDDIRDALDDCTEWYDPEEFKDNYNKGRVDGFLLGMISTPLLASFIAGIWMFIHSAAAH